MEEIRFLQPRRNAIEIERRWNLIAIREKANLAIQRLIHVRRITLNSQHEISSGRRTTAGTLEPDRMRQKIRRPEGHHFETVALWHVAGNRSAQTRKPQIVESLNEC